MTAPAILRNTYLLGRAFTAVASATPKTIQVGMRAEGSSALISARTFYQPSTASRFGLTTSSVASISSMRAANASVLPIRLFHQSVARLENIPDLPHAIPAAIDAKLVARKEAAELAQRFRPYYKFSVDGSNEGKRPCSWEWFVQHSKLVPNSNSSMNQAQLDLESARLDVPNHPEKILLLGNNNGDVRLSEIKKPPFILKPFASAYAGQPWNEVVDGAGLYAQVEQVPEKNLVVIIYWTLYARNEATALPSQISHDGDISAVAVVYDRAKDKLVRASFVIHGTIVESFDLQGPALERDEAFRFGKTVAGEAESVQAKKLQIAADHCYQNIDSVWWKRMGYQKSSPHVYLVQDSANGKFEHLALFTEWGTHEAWPNATGSITLMPKHSGDGISFLPKQVKFLGSITAPEPDQAPFLFFNGKWGDPPSPVFHRTCFDPRFHRNDLIRPTTGIPNDEDHMSDRDPYYEGLSWPPQIFAQAKIVASVIGNRPSAQVALRWGHPDYHQNEYFPTWTIRHGQTQEKQFYWLDRKSEFEVQTEGGVGTGYKISISIDNGSGNGELPAQPSIVLKHKIDNVTDQHEVVTANVSAVRSAGVNRYGEQNIRVDTEGRVAGPIYDEEN